MEQQYSVYGLILTYDDTKVEFDPAEYQRTHCTKVKHRYQKITTAHIKALVESIRRHVTTRLGRNWEAVINVCSSCNKGYFIDYMGLVKNKKHGQKCSRKNNPMETVAERLHIHVLVEGIPGRTIAGYIASYWSKRFGIVEFEKYEVNAYGDWWAGYTASQSLKRSRIKVEKMKVVWHGRD